MVHRSVLWAVLLLILMILSSCASPQRVESTVTPTSTLEPMPTVVSAVSSLTESNRSTLSVEKTVETQSENTQDICSTPEPSTITETVVTEDPADDEGRLVLEVGEDASAGVWWWNNSSVKSLARRAKYLDFLKSNSINEIYLCVGNMSERQIASFLTDCAAREMKVYWLAGDASFIIPGRAEGENFYLDAYFSYQNAAPEDLRFAGVHMDVEPHQLPDFFDKREEYLNDFAQYAVSLARVVRARGETIAFDLPFWFDKDEVVFEEEQISLLALLAREADCLTMMSYRDRAEDMIALCEDEIAACREYGCKIVLAADCLSQEAPHVSFIEGGKEALAREIPRLFEMLRSEDLPGGFGIAIHHLESWYTLE